MKALKSFLVGLFIMVVPVISNAQTVVGWSSSPAPYPFAGSVATISYKASGLIHEDGNFITAQLPGLHKVQPVVISSQSIYAIEQIDTVTLNYNAYQAGAGPANTLYSVTVAIPATITNPVTSAVTDGMLLINYDPWKTILEASTQIPSGSVKSLMAANPAPSPLLWATCEIDIRGHWILQTSDNVGDPSYAFTGQSTLSLRVSR